MGSRRVLVDTSIFIDYFRKENKQNSILHSLVKEEYILVTSAICYFEYRLGSKDELFDKILFSNIEVISLDKVQADIASKIYKDLKKRNTLIEFRDILISSCAISLKIPLATLNVKHSKRILDLDLLEL